MRSSKYNGSLTHVRYGHIFRPRLLEVVCLSCGNLAQATKPTEDEYKGVVVSDLSPSYSENDWIVKCLNYPKRLSGLSYDELKVWAWNWEHANCIINYLSGKDTSDNPYDWFMTYLRKAWKKKPEKVIAQLQKIHN